MRPSFEEGMEANVGPGGKAAALQAKTPREELEMLAKELRAGLFELIERSAIEERFPDDGGPVVVITAHRWKWGPLDSDAQVLLDRTRKLLEQWLELAGQAVRVGARERENDFVSESDRLRSVIERGSASCGPSKTKENTAFYVADALDGQQAIIADLPSAHGVAETLVVPDTNALLWRPDLEAWDFACSARIIILPQVVRELDRLKLERGVTARGKKAEKMIRRLKEYGRRGETLDGVTIKEDLTLREVAIEADMSQTLPWLRAGHEDDQLLASVLELKWRNLNASMILVTRDRNLQNKARLARMAYVDPEEVLLPAP